LNKRGLVRLGVVRRLGKLRTELARFMEWVGSCWYGVLVRDLDTRLSLARIGTVGRVGLVWLGSYGQIMTGGLIWRGRVRGGHLV